MLSGSVAGSEAVAQFITANQLGIESTKATVLNQFGAGLNQFIRLRVNKPTQPCRLFLTNENKAKVNYRAGAGVAFPPRTWVGTAIGSILRTKLLAQLAIPL